MRNLFRQTVGLLSDLFLRGGLVDSFVGGDVLVDFGHRLGTPELILLSSRLKTQKDIRLPSSKIIRY